MRNERTVEIVHEFWVTFIDGKLANILTTDEEANIPYRIVRGIDSDKVLFQKYMDIICILASNSSFHSQFMECLSYVSNDPEVKKLMMKVYKHDFDEIKVCDSFPNISSYMDSLEVPNINPNASKKWFDRQICVQDGYVVMVEEGDYHAGRTVHRGDADFSSSFKSTMRCMSRLNFDAFKSVYKSIKERDKICGEICKEILEDMLEDM